MKRQIKKESAHSQNKRLPLERGKVAQQLQKDSDKGGASAFHEFGDPEDMLELIGNDQGSGSRDISDQNASTDKLQEVCDSQDCAHDAECANHETE